MDYEDEHHGWNDVALEAITTPEPNDTGASGSIANLNTQPYRGYPSFTDQDAGPRDHLEVVMGRGPDETSSDYATGQQLQLADRAADLVLPYGGTSRYLLTQEHGWELSGLQALPIDQYPMQVPDFNFTTAAPPDLTGDQEHAGNRVPSISLGSPLLNQEHCDNFSGGDELSYFQEQSSQHNHTAVEPWTHFSVVDSTPSGSTAHSNNIFYESQSAGLSASDVSQDEARLESTLTPEDTTTTNSSEPNRKRLADSLATLKAHLKPREIVCGSQQRSIGFGSSSYDGSYFERDQGSFRQTNHHGSHMIAAGGNPSTTSQYLAAPDNCSHGTCPTSPALSAVSTNPSNVSEALSCKQEGCMATFRGTYRNGNRQRHCRLKHGHVERTYLCEAGGCNKTFKRQDARLKHYRSRHPYLAPDPIEPRR